MPKAGAAVVGLLLLGISHQASAEPVYRCGNAYQDHSCPGATTIDAQPNAGIEVRSQSGAVVHSREGGQGSYCHQMEIIRDIQHNALACAVAGDFATAKNNRIECRASKTQEDAKRLTSDYIRK